MNGCECELEIFENFEFNYGGSAVFIVALIPEKKNIFLNLGVDKSEIYDMINKKGGNKMARKRSRKRKTNANSNPNLAYVTKASTEEWYKIVSLNSIETIFRLVDEYDKIIIEEDWYYTDEKSFKFWDTVKKEDIPKIIEAKYHITIYDDYIE